MTPDSTPQEIPHIDLTGTVVGGFRLDERLGGDARTAVYRARKLLEAGEYAVKIVQAGFAPDSTFARQFEAYTRVLRAVRHPSVATVHTAGTFEYGYFMVMDYVAGETLAQRMARGRLSPQEIQSIIHDVAAGLHALHQKDIVHRNITPNNVMLSPSGTAIITDFGIALLPNDTGFSALRHAITLPYYVAPELLTGASATPAADIYALGVLLFEMLAGTPPYVAASPLGVWQKHQVATIPNIQDFAPDVPNTVKSLLEQALAKDPAARFGSAPELAETLANVWRDDEISTVLPVGSSGGTVILPPLFSTQQKKAQTKKQSIGRGKRWIFVATMLLLLAIFSAWGQTLLNPKPHLDASLSAATPTPTPSPTLTLTISPTDTPLPTATRAAPTPIPPTRIPTVAPTSSATATIAPSPTVAAPTVTPTISDLLADLRGKILFKTNRNGTVEIFQMDADGSHQISLSTARAFLYNEAVRWEAFSGNHQQTVAVRGAGQFDLWWVNLADGTETRLTSNPAADYDPVWSPINARIAFVSERTGNGNLYLFNLENGGLQQLTDDANAFDKHPSWSPDGRELAFWSNRGGQNQRQIWRMDVEDDSVVNLSQNNFDDWDPVWVK